MKSKRKKGATHAEKRHFGIKAPLQKRCLHLYEIARLLCGQPKNILLHIDETFLNLEEDEFYKYLEIAKKALSGTIGNNLLELSFRRDEAGEESQKFFLALRDSALKQDGLLDLLYERIIREYDFAGNYLILLFHTHK